MRRTFGVDRVRLANMLRDALASERAPEGVVSLQLVGDRTMRRINRDHRGVDSTTDVLSFSYIGEPHSGDVLGEIFVSPDVARRQASQAECDLAEEIARLSAHGLLHVLGYDHDTPRTRRNMLRRERRYLERHFGAEVPC